MTSDCTYSGKPHYLSLKDTRYFSKLVVDYIDQKEDLKPFYQFAPDWSGMASALSQREAFPIDRNVLVTVLKETYATASPHALVSSHIDLLHQPNTFTITTAHQPNLATGYAYFMYKIMHTVVLADEMKQRHPEYNFVPVYYIGSEDDDIKELGFFRFNQSSFRWETNQTGAVGQMNPTELKSLLHDFFRVLGPPNASTEYLKGLLENAYLGHDTIAQATQYIVHELFQAFGVLVVDANHHLLKKQFTQVLLQELLQPVAHQLVQEQNQLLSVHYKSQAHARVINLFYLKDGLRKRIEKVADNLWRVVDTDIKWDAASLTLEVEQYPEHFSPNVILRGLYQESILPNVAFIGGGAEVAYWFQLKPIFDHYNVFYPTIILRQSAQFITLHQQELMKRLDWDYQAIFKPLTAHIDELVKEQAEQELTVDEEWLAIKNVLANMTAKATQVDANLAYSAAAAIHKMEHQVHVLVHKMNKAERKKHEVTINRMKALKSELFPNGSLQERYYTFMQEYVYLGPQYFEWLRKFILPFGNEFLIIS